MSFRIFRRLDKGPWLISTQFSFQRESRAIVVRDALNILKAEAAVSHPSKSMSELIADLLVAEAFRLESLRWNHMCEQCYGGGVPLNQEEGGECQCCNGKGVISWNDDATLGAESTNGQRREMASGTATVPTADTEASDLAPAEEQ